MKPIRAIPLRALCLALLCLALLAGQAAYAGDAGNASPGGLLGPVLTFEGGAAYRTDADLYWALSLSGTWREMGRQYGGLVGAELRQFYAEITKHIADEGMDLDAQLESARAFSATCNPNMGDLMDGLAETSGLNKEEVLLLNASMSNLADVLLTPLLANQGCSCLAVWDGYTPDGTLTVGRNWDMIRPGMMQYMKYLAVVAYNPDEGYSFADVHPLGNLYVETGINEKGLFLELNNGGQSDPGCFAERENSVSVMFTALNRCDDADGAAAYLASVPADYSYIIQAADAGKCVSVERPTYGCRVRAGTAEGLLAAYNSFIPPYPEDWQGKVAAPPPQEADPRYQNLVDSANSEAFYGRLDAEGMKRLLELDIAHGGAVHDGTVLQVIAIPAELRLWIRGYDFSDWQQVDVGGLFR